MNDKENKYVPKINFGEIKDNPSNEINIVGNSPCPCCGFITIPNNGDALAYICPVCFWEIDLFIQREDEASDQNHGLTLLQARKNYKHFGAVLPRLKENCRQPKKSEYPPTKKARIQS